MRTDIAALEERIIAIRGQRVMLDRDLADLYGVATRVVNQAFRRNKTRFPEGFAFRLTGIEQAELISASPRLRTLRHANQPSLVFTDYGVAMLSSVLRSPRAARVNVRIIQAFVRMRRLSALDRDLRDAVSALQAKVGEHDQAIGVLMDALGRLTAGFDEGRVVIGFSPEDRP